MSVQKKEYLNNVAEKFSLSDELIVMYIVYNTISYILIFVLM